jgi:hypothetical protein
MRQSILMLRLTPGSLFFQADVMRAVRPRHLGIAAMLMAVAAVLATRREDRSRHVAPGPGRGEPAAPAASSRLRSAAVPAVPTRSSAPSGVRASTANASAVAAKTAIPTELPDSPVLQQQLSRDGASPDWREGYTYQLGLMAFYEECMAGRIAHGVIYYYITWQIDDDHLGSSPVFEFAGEPMQGDISDDDRLAFAACVKEYIATHDHLSLPGRNPPRMVWGMGAIFPLSESPLLKMIAEATTPNGSGHERGGAASAPANSAVGHR